MATLQLLEEPRLPFNEPQTRLDCRRIRATAATVERIVLEEVHRAAVPITEHLRLELDPADREGWIGLDVLANPELPPFADLHGRFVEAGFACNRKAASASLLLRYGWAAGFHIAVWLERGLVLHLDRFALKFSGSTLLEALWARQARLDEPASQAQGREQLLASLLAFTEPLVESHHRWSRFSRYALWAMIVSSWAAQFASIGEKLGRRDEAMREARLTFARHPEIARAAPKTYVVRAGKNSRVCQVRSACCLYFKGPAKHFCASCPIIPKEERLARNRDFTSSGGQSETRTQ